MGQVLQRLSALPLAAAMRGEHGWEWLFPIIESLHVISLGLVVGSILLLDVRLLGFGRRTAGVLQLGAEILPLTWVGFAAASLTGTALFLARPGVYFHNPQFELKLLCIALAGVNMAVFHFGIYRRAREWEADRTPPAAARAAGALSILLWSCAIVFGRWTGFTT